MAQEAQRRWSPRAYPAQSCPANGAEVNGYPPLPPDPEEEDIQLPITIRAVQDVKSQTSFARTLIICLDGTGDKFDNDNSNVVNLVACLKKDDPNQLTYYQSGIGTYDGHGMKRGITAAFDMAIGSGLGVHIKDAYHFLMQNYNEGDKICLFGFSRGSYTVRCLAGMLHKVGLLPRHNIAQINFAYKFYKDDTPEGWKMSAEFKKTFCQDVDVYFVGVWDCVASVGFIPRKLPFSKTPTGSIHYFRHAMALDEHRAKFKVLQWAHKDPAADPNTMDNTPKAKAKAKKNSTASWFKSCFGSGKVDEEANAYQEKKPSTLPPSDFDLRLKKLHENHNKEQRELVSKFEAREKLIHQAIKTDVKEVWFAGAHADVGGGAVKNEERHVLSRIPLRWMIRQCFECDTGIIFSAAGLAEIGIDVPTVHPVYKRPGIPIVGPSPDMVEGYEAKLLPPLRRRSTALGIHDERMERCKREVQRVESQDGEQSGRWETEFDLLPEQVEDHFDAMAPINDQLVQAKGWWVLEFWPVKVRVEKKQPKNHEKRWEKVVRMNLGRFRAVREMEPKMHWTVQMRMGEKDYKVRNRVDSEAVWGVTA